jgi:D-sedoheptulose 7-phosphate isomerase
MRSTTKAILDDLIIRYDALKDCYSVNLDTVNLLVESYKNGNKLLICGNGGSAADADHIVGELMKGFLLPRTLSNDTQEQLNLMFPETADYLITNLQKALPAISLVSQTALITAFANDKAADLLFAQQVLGYGNKGDVLLAISTSGNSKNVIYAAQIAKFKGMRVISLTGASGGHLKELSDVLINVPSEETFIIQEYHLPVYHALCACIENEFFSDKDI